MDLAFWNAVFKVVAVVAAGITFAVGAGALWTENQINQRQAATLLALRRDLAEQQARAATAEKSLLEVQDRLSDRRLSEEQQTRLVQQLSRLPHCPVKVIYPDSGEPQRFADMVINLFKKAGWAVERGDKIPLLGQPGITLIRQIKGAPVECMEGVRTIFASIGIDVTATTQDFDPLDPNLELLIGPKP